MIEIIGAILIAFILIATMERWLPLLILLLMVAIPVAGVLLFLSVLFVSHG